MFLLRKVTIYFTWCFSALFRRIWGQVGFTNLLLLERGAGNLIGHC